MSRWRPESGMPPLFCLAVLLALSACQPQPPEASPASSPLAAETSQTHYGQLAAQGVPVYQIERQASQAIILVRREGPLARFGHDHAIVAGNVNGFIAWPMGSQPERSADLWLEVAGLEIDPPAAREAFALDTSPSEQDIEATRGNLLRHVLPGARWPLVRMSIRRASGEPPDLRLDLSLELNGVTRTLQVPAHTEASEDRLTATGSFVLRQTDWNIEPFSVLGGGLRVADSLEIHFQLAATRLWHVPE